MASISSPEVPGSFIQIGNPQALETSGFSLNAERLDVPSNCWPLYFAGGEW